MTEVALLVAAVVLLATYLTWTASRLDRLAARVEAAWSALDAQLVRRAAAAGPARRRTSAGTAASTRPPPR
jgi:hypothetical protein